MILEELKRHHDAGIAQDIYDLWEGFQSVKDPRKREEAGWQAFLELFPTEDDFIQHLFLVKSKKVGRIVPLKYNLCYCWIVS